jgi:putative ABC transport system permease protein
MSKISMGAILRRSLIHRRARSISALVALTVSAAIATALLTLYSDLDTKLHREFRSFGANIIVTSANSASYLAPGTLARAQMAAGPDARAVEFAYAVVRSDRGTPLVAVGTSFEAAQKLNSWWQVDSWPSLAETNTALVGQRAASTLGQGQTVQLTFADHPITLHRAGTLRTGGDEDSRVYLPLSTFTTWTGVKAGVIELQVPGSSSQIEAAIGRLKTAIPEAKVEPVRQLVDSENRIVEKTHALMYGSVLLIGLTVTVSVLATLSASVLERRRDFALMKALGGSQRQLTMLFLVEALVLALSGVAVGYLVGSAVAWAISQLNFHTSTLPRISVLPAVLLLNLLIAALAALFPTRLLRRLEPAALLKGE